MNGPIVIALVLAIAAAITAGGLIGSSLIREALDELDARREWAAIQRRTEARRHLSTTAPRSPR